MALICDRSPCDPLLKALGVWIFGTRQGRFVAVVIIDDRESEVPIVYCPFCGTRMDEVGGTDNEKYFRYFTAKTRAASTSRKRTRVPA